LQSPRNNNDRPALLDGPIPCVPMTACAQVGFLPWILAAKTSGSRPATSWGGGAPIALHDEFKPPDLLRRLRAAIEENSIDALVIGCR